MSNLKVEFHNRDMATIIEAGEFGEESDAIPLELAYALTVHKAQGSEFEKVILVISEPGFLLSKELLYTAITRQSRRLVVLNAESYQLRNYASKEFSDIARRFTNLFEKPEIVIYGQQRYYEASLIHRTLKEN